MVGSSFEVAGGSLTGFEDVDSVARSPCPSLVLLGGFPINASTILSIAEVS